MAEGFYGKLITIDLSNGEKFDVIAQQNDTGRFLNISLKDKGNDYDLTGKTVRAYVTKADGSKCYVDCDNITDNEDVTNLCKMQITSQMLAINERAIVQLKISDGETSIKSYPFGILPGKDYTDDDAIESSNEYTALENMIKSIDSGNYETDVTEAVSTYIANNGLTTNAKDINVNGAENVKDILQEHLYVDIFTSKGSQEGYTISSVGKLMSNASSGITTSALHTLPANQVYYFPGLLSTIAKYKSDGTFIEKLSSKTDYVYTPTEDVLVRISYVSDSTNANYRNNDDIHIYVQKDDTESDTIFLNYDSTYKNVGIYMKTKQDWLKYVFKYATRNSTEKEAAIAGGDTLASCYVSWRERGVYRAIKGLGNNFTIVNSGDPLIHSAAEWEMAIKECLEDGVTEQPDFVGGTVHGDEVVTSICFMVDGKVYTTASDLVGVSCKEFKIFRVSDVYRCGTLELDSNLAVTAGTKIATHYTDYTYKNGELTINQDLKWLVATTCNYSAMAMLGVRRVSENNSIQISNKGLREGEGIAYDCSVADFSNALATSLANCKKAYVWNDGTVSGNAGWNCSFSAEVLEQTDMPGKNFKVSNHDAYNKMYFGYCSLGQVVNVGDVWHCKAKYRCDFNGEY